MDNQLNEISMKILQAYADAREEAIKKGIEANMMVINSKFAFIKPFVVGEQVFGHKSIISFDSMIAGMHTIFAKLPEDIDYLALRKEFSSYKDGYDILKKLKRENKKLRKENKDLKKILGVKGK